MTETAQFELEFRTADEPRREAVLLVCRYGETSLRSPKARLERFLPGAFTRSVTAKWDGIPITTAHSGGDGRLPSSVKVARPKSWDTSSAAELRARVKFYDTPDGWDAWKRAAEGEFSAGSVGFVAVEERTGADGAREIGEANLHHFALLSRAEAVPAYEAPRVLETRTVPDWRRAAELLAVRYEIERLESCHDAAAMARLIYDG